MSKEWTAFYPYLQPYLPGCPEMTMDYHLQMASEDLCKRSAVWREPLGPITTVAGVSDYKIYSPGQSRLSDVLSLFVGGSPTRRVTDVYRGHHPNTPAALPSTYMVFGDEEVRLFPTPDAEYVVQGTMVLTPSARATRVPDFLFEDYLQTICDGALASLLAIPAKEWSNPEYAAVYSAKFWRGADDAKRQDIRSSGVHVRPRPAA